MGILPVYLSERSSGRTDFGSDRDGNDFLAVQAMDKTRVGQGVATICLEFQGDGQGSDVGVPF